MKKLINEHPFIVVSAKFGYTEWTCHKCGYGFIEDDGDRDHSHKRETELFNHKCLKTGKI